uniref:Uncharacterized protein n=1 Tax=uncultured Desulfobacterium sp. TaxID=201089 RepID=E1Y831_9BACT|nr:hypothetical protein N47_A07540 [uncultured Desulfobacterium sp.]
MFFYGCGEKAEETAIEKQIKKATGSEAKVDISDNKIHIAGNTEQGSFTMSVGKSAEIPKDFPTDIFIYKPSQTAAAMKMPEGYSISLTTENEVAKVAQTYQKEMKSEGWSEKANMNFSGQSVFVYEKDSRIANIAIASAEGITNITLTIAKK